MVHQISQVSRSIRPPLPRALDTRRTAMGRCYRRDVNTHEHPQSGDAEEKGISICLTSPSCDFRSQSSFYQTAIATGRTVRRRSANSSASIRRDPLAVDGGSG